MSFESPKEKPEPEAVPEGASDKKVAEFFARHIDEPCEVEVSPGRVENIRGFYLREARRILPDLTDPAARDFLEQKIQEYEK